MSIPFSENNGIIDFGKTVVLSKAKAEGKIRALSYSLDNIRYFAEEIRENDGYIDLDNLVCRYLKVEGGELSSFSLGEGYIGAPAKEYDALFVRKEGWMGGDGLFTFNLFGGREKEAERVRTLCVFGDTFLNTRGNDDSRLSPWLMLHNSYAIIEGKEPNENNISFHIKQGEKGNYLPYLEPDNALSKIGSDASNLVDYGVNEAEPYLSSYNPQEDIEIVFSFFASYPIDKIRIVNYFLNERDKESYAKRGVKELEIYGKTGSEFVFLKKISLSTAKNANDEILANLGGISCSAIKFVISKEVNVGNHGGYNGHEALFGLNKVYFESEGRDLIDIEADSNSVLSINDKHAFFWLQDGLIDNGRFYSLPLVGITDLSAPEGFQFRIEGVSMILLPIEDGYPNFLDIEQRSTNLYTKSGESKFTYGAAILDNRKKDGYIYIYGYVDDPSRANLGKGMVVARTKEFPNVNEYEFFDGSSFQKDIKKAKPVLNHISTELSVFFDSGHYIAIFSYDVQSPYIAYALSSTPFGPFSPIRIAYAYPEKIAPHQYDYNAKGHLHLSKEGDILVSLNVNTSNLEENIRFASIYGPRFIRLRFSKEER